MSKYVLYFIVFILDLMLMGVIPRISLFSIFPMIPMNIFFFIVLLHAHYHSLNVKEVIVLFALGLGLDVFYATPIFVNAMSLIIVVVFSHYIKTYLNDTQFERVVFLFIVLFFRELFNYVILFVTLNTTLIPLYWFTQRTFFVLIFNIPWMFVSVSIFARYQHIETLSQKRRRQAESLLHYR